MGVKVQHGATRLKHLVSFTVGFYLQHHKITTHIYRICKLTKLAQSFAYHRTLTFVITGHFERNKEKKFAEYSLM